MGESLSRELAEEVRRLGDRIASLVTNKGNGLNSFDLPEATRSSPQQEIFVVYGEARANVRVDGKGINADAEIFDFDGKPVGRKVLNAMTTAQNLQDLARVPSSPRVDVKDLESPVENVEPTTLKKATWTFEGGSITAIGKGVSHAVQLRDGGALFMDSAAMTITSGTGKYEGARGVVTTDGSSFFPPGEKTPLENPGGRISQQTIEVFKIILGKDVEPT